MNRDLFNDLPEVEGFDKKAFVDKIMKANGEDVEKAKAKQVKDIEAERDNLKVELDDSNKQLEDLKSQVADKDKTIEELEQSVGNEEELKAKLEEYKQKEKDAEEERKQAELEAGLKARFETVTDGAEFIDPYVKDGVFNEFKDALEAPENKGKGDKEIYTELMKGNEGRLKQQQSFPNMSGMGKPDVDVSTVEKFKGMSLKERMEFANSNPDVYAEIKDLVD